MDLTIASKQTGHLMTDLDIKSERCEELCTVIQDSIMELHSEGKDKVTLAQVVQRALKHSKNDTESVFVAITAGEYHASYLQWRDSGHSMSDMFSSILKGTTQHRGN